MKKLFILFISFLPLHAVLAQEDTILTELIKIEGDIVDFTVDNLGNLYTLDKNDQLKKLSAQGDSIAVFNDVKHYGKVGEIDAANPLKVLLYYQDFGTILVLDKFLNVRNRIDIRKQGIFQARAIAQSFDNGIWIYDEREARLKRISDDGALIDQSSDFRQIMDTAISPVQMMDQDRLIYLYDPAQGLFVFDYFGTLKNRIALLDWQDFQVMGPAIFGRKGTVLERYQLNSLALKELELGDKLQGAEKIKIAMNYLYCLKKGTITIYTYMRGKVNVTAN